MDYKNTLSSAQDYANHGKIEDWIHEYLLTDGNNREFSDGLKLSDRYFIGPQKMPLSLFSRCCGPEENMKWRVNAEGFEKRVSNLMNVIKSEYDMPPILVNFVENTFVINDGNHRLEAYTRLGINEISVIIWITDKQDYEHFCLSFLNHE